MNEVVLNELPENWAWTKLGDVVTKIIGGGTPSKDNPNYWEGDIPWLTVKDMRSRRPADAMDHISEKAVQESSTNIIPADTVIIATRIGLGKVIRVPYKAAINQDLKALILPPEIEKGYLEYWFVSKTNYLESIGSGTTVKGIRLEQVRDLDFPLAPPEQQKRIVAKVEELFSHIDAGIEALKKAKQLLKQYRQSILKAAVTGELTKEWREANKDKLESATQLLERILKERREKWEEQQLEQFKANGKIPKNDKWKEKYKEPVAYDGTPLFELPEEWCWVFMGQVGEVIGGLTKNRKREQLNKQLPYLRVANVYANELRLDDVTKIGVQENELNRVLLEKGDLLIVEGNGSPEQIGRLAIWDGSIEPCVHQNHLIKVRLQENKCGNYLMYWLSSLGGRDAILQVASSTSGLYTLSISKVSGLPVPFPPLGEQIEIYNAVSSKLSSIERLEQEIDVQLIKVDKKKQSILLAAFSGNLEKRLANDGDAKSLLESIEAQSTKKEISRSVKLPREKVVTQLKINSVESDLISVIYKLFGVDNFTIEELLIMTKGKNFTRLKSELFELIKNQVEGKFRLDMQFDEKDGKYVFSLVPRSLT